MSLVIKQQTGFDRLKSAIFITGWAEDAIDKFWTESIRNKAMNKIPSSHQITWCVTVYNMYNNSWLENFERIGENLLRIFVLRVVRLCPGNNINKYQFLTISGFNFNICCKHRKYTLLLKTVKDAKLFLKIRRNMRQ